MSREKKRSPPAHAECWRLNGKNAIFWRVNSTNATKRIWSAVTCHRFPLFAFARGNKRCTKKREGNIFWRNPGFAGRQKRGQVPALQINVPAGITRYWEAEVRVECLYWQAVRVATKYRHSPSRYSQPQFRFLSRSLLRPCHRSHFPPPLHSCHSMAASPLARIVHSPQSFRCDDEAREWRESPDGR